MSNSYTLLLPSEGMNKYQKRNIGICIVIMIFIIATGIFTALVFTGFIEARTEEDTDETIDDTTWPPAKRKPNILLVMADDLRPSLSCYGDPLAITPNIDQLANSGVLFTNAFAQEAICAPSRTSLLTSRRPDSLHVYANDNSYGYWRTTVGNYTTLPQYFKENGYYTASIGKIFHDGVVSNKSDDYPYSWSQLPFHPATKKHKMDKVCPDIDGQLRMNLICPVDVKTQPGGSLPDIESTEYAKYFLENYAESETKEPFFLGVGFYKPHIPLKYPKEFLDFYDIKRFTMAPNPSLPPTLPPVAWNPWTDIRLRDDMAKLNMSFPYGPMPNSTQLFVKQSYYASVTYIDDLLGEILLSLEETNLAKDTIVIFMGDHGWSLGEHQEWSKYSNYEIALKVPLIINTPEKRSRPFQKLKARAKRSNHLISWSPSPLILDQMVELVDLFPTLVNMADLPPVPKCSNDTRTTLCTEGLNFAPLLTNKTIPWKKAVFAQYPRPFSSPRNDSDQPTLENVEIMGYTIRTDMYRYTEWVKFNHTGFKANWSDIVARELYDHRFDEMENVNLAFEFPDIDAYMGTSNYNKSLNDVIEELSEKLKLGWREENGGIL